MALPTDRAEPLAVLRRVRRAPRPLEQERCDICATAVAAEHHHIVDLDSRSLRCACQACALLFTNQGAAGGRWRTVPADVYELPSLTLTAAQWEVLQIPVGVAWLFHNSDTGGTSAFYPGPAGATESLLPLGAFDDLAAAEPALQTLLPDVEALLVRFDRSGSDCLIVPIDRCYELVGILRQSWRGFDGGTEAHARIDEFFAALGKRARPVQSRLGQVSRG
ncbi:MAG TPA: DUF5947 family protein [Acidimicrobiales bacterium]|nr:DUF5947 family protein [Acidimicrobiales bacterium]